MLTIYYKNQLGNNLPISWSLRSVIGSNSRREPQDLCRRKDHIIKGSLLMLAQCQLWQPFGKSIPLALFTMTVWERAGDSLPFRRGVNTSRDNFFAHFVELCGLMETATLIQGRERFPCASEPQVPETNSDSGIKTVQTFLKTFHSFQSRFSVEVLEVRNVRWVFCETAASSFPFWLISSPF